MIGEDKEKTSQQAENSSRNRYMTNPNEEIDSVQKRVGRLQVRPIQETGSVAKMETWELERKLLEVRKRFNESKNPASSVDLIEEIDRELSQKERALSADESRL